jgi:molybdopterin-guanine dinucleotide biosynthesis protein A
VELVQRLAREQSDALVLAPREHGLWQPLAARYGTAALARLDETLVAGERSFQRFFARLGDDAAELVLSASDPGTLVDWDRPEDMR